ncbi:olfactory receptor 14C36-like [Dasypus novemcinctus]|uniref:olfactory receptor 14C36-like n=1 Tax=Dasypus novemcinctus TaxID=9361 RepID=UPI00032925DF|nr:olfactory receptor 14C36-like [Dasypus novemcinctus]
MPNSTMVTEFLLIRFSDVWEYRLLHGMLFFLMCLASLMGNFIIVTRQETPYSNVLFLRNLSFLDTCYISVTVPKACVIFLLDNKTISMVGCAAQIFFVFLFSPTELLFLTIMARDCYVAICQPLHYLMNMSPLVCVQKTLSSVANSMIYAGFYAGNIFQLDFCESNVVHQFFCDAPSLLKLSCSDTLSKEIFIFTYAVAVAGGCFTFITMSYIHIFSTVLKFPAREE